MLRPTYRPPEPRPRPRGLLAAGAVLGAVTLVGLGGAVAVGPIVRARVAKEADRRHLDVDVGSVRPGFFAVVLQNVRVKLRGVPGIAVDLDEVRGELSATFALRELVVQGGRLELDGEPEELAERLKTFRRDAGESEDTNDAPKGKSRLAVTASGLALAWRAPSGATLAGEGLRFARGEGAMRLGAERLATTRDKVTIETRGLDLELGGPGRGVLRKASATTIDVTFATGPREVSSPKAANAITEPAPPPLPPPLPGKGKPPRSASTKGATPPPRPAGKDGDAIADEPVLPLPDLLALRARIRAIARELDAHVPDGVRADVGGLSLKLDAAGEPIAFGPGPFSLERRGTSLHVTFSSGAPAAQGAAPGTPLAVDLELPLAAGDVVARLAGGPVSLAALGVTEGTKGLADVARGTVSGKGQLALAGGGEAVTFDGEVALRGISVTQPKLAPEPIKDLAFGASARGVLEATGRLRLDEAELDMGALHLKTHGTLEETRDHFAVSLGVEVAAAGCQALLDSAPRGLLPTVQDMRMTGTFGATAQVAFDTRTIDKLLLDYKVDDTCRFLEVPRDLSRDRFARPFTYRTYHPDGTAAETTTGPGSTDWTDLDDISPFMVAAVLTTEDGAFYKHHGFNHAAIRGSVQANLKARRFVRGASTITMQLAKNLFLSRSKNLSRKVEEVILTDYLEQVFQKDEMMELYLNVVEFGPDVYGITRAAEHYFGRKPEELNLPEAFFLATLLPSPIRYGKLRERGQVTDGWMKHLRALMEIAAKNGKISRAELAEGLEQTITFVKSGDPRPEPRKAVSSKRRDAEGDDVNWQPLD